MSLSGKSKSKDKKLGKEPLKDASKPGGSANAGSGVPASAYNPHWGTFHALESLPTGSVSPLQANGHFQKIDEMDEQYGVSVGVGIEYDTVSNNGSWSGESEDHKEKVSATPTRQEMIPGADNDKREKIRQKNEKKHQRQKERRAQELHERCCGYLMSRKLEVLAQQLLAMGFSHERATMALMLNEGRVEESVAWLFEGGEEADKNVNQNLRGANLKIDISEELAQIAAMELTYKCSKQEVERAVVSSEGHLKKAAKALQALKQELQPGLPKPQETGDPPTSSNKISLAAIQNSVKLQPRPNPPSVLQQRRDEKELNYTRVASNVSEAFESGLKNVQPIKRIQSKLEWAKIQQNAMPVDKKWPPVSNSVSYSLASPLQVSPSPVKAETSFGNEIRSLQSGSMREPVIMMHRPQSSGGKQGVTGAGTSPGTTGNQFPTNNIEMAKSNGFLSQISSNGSLGQNGMPSNQFYHQLQYQQQFGLVSSLAERPGTSQGNGHQSQHFVPGSGVGDFSGVVLGSGSWSRTANSPTLAAASSLGLFSGMGSTSSSGASSPVDWSSGSSVLQLDYSSIDWSLDRGLLSPRSRNLCLGLSSFSKNNGIYDTIAAGVGTRPILRSVPATSISLSRRQDGTKVISESSTAGTQEWSSPFEGRDLFSLPRQFVSSPSL